MLGFGNSGGAAQAGARASAHVIDGSDATFMADVVEASSELPVIVDFWAPWCGPCKTLGPALEAEVERAAGKVRMVKINVDENPQIAGQLRIQSIPTVYAFWQGQPVDGFQGAVGPADLRRFVEKLTGLAGDGGLSEALAQAEALLEQGAAADAVQIYAAILAQIPDNAAAHAGMIRAHLATGQTDEAEALLANLPAEVAGSKEIEAVRAQIALAAQAAAAGPVAELRARLAAQPDDHQTRFDLAVALHGAGQTEEAVDMLLDLFARDREWNDGAARAQLFTIFEALKPQDPIVLRGRRRLSSMIFA